MPSRRAAPPANAAELVTQFGVDPSFAADLMKVLDLMKAAKRPMTVSEGERPAWKQMLAYLQGHSNIAADGKHQVTATRKPVAADLRFIDPKTGAVTDQGPWDLVELAAKQAGMRWGGDWKEAGQIRDRRPIAQGGEGPPTPFDPLHVEYPDARIAAMMASNGQPPTSQTASPLTPGSAEARTGAGGLGVSDVSGVDRGALLDPIDQILQSMASRRGDIWLGSGPPPPPDTRARWNPSMEPPNERDLIGKIMEGMASRKGDIAMPSQPPATGPTAGLSNPVAKQEAQPSQPPLPSGVSAPPPTVTSPVTPASPLTPSPAAASPLPPVTLSPSSLNPSAPPEGEAMIRVGVMPSMVGREGTDPIVVTIPRATRPEDVQAVALAKAQAAPVAEEGPRERARLGIQGPGDKFMGLDFDRQTLADATSMFAHAFPQAAGTALSLALPASRGLQFLIPAGLEFGQQALRGEKFDPVEAGSAGLLQGAISSLFNSVAPIAKGIGKVGRQKITKVLRFPMGENTPSWDTLRTMGDLAADERVVLSEAGEQALRDKAAALRAAVPSAPPPAPPEAVMPGTITPEKYKATGGGPRRRGARYKAGSTPPPKTTVPGERPPTSLPPRPQPPLEKTVAADPSMGFGSVKQIPYPIRPMSQWSKADQLDALADIASLAARKDAAAASRSTLWPQEALANWARRAPRNMAVGQAMARIGRNSKDIEATARMLAAGGFGTYGMILDRLKAAQAAAEKAKRPPGPQRRTQ